MSDFIKDLFLAIFLLEVVIAVWVMWRLHTRPARRKQLQIRMRDARASCDLLYQMRKVYIQLEESIPRDPRLTFLKETFNAKVDTHNAILEELKTDIDRHNHNPLF